MRLDPVVAGALYLAAENVLKERQGRTDGATRNLEKALAQAKDNDEHNRAVMVAIHHDITVFNARNGPVGLTISLPHRPGGYGT
jgi:hypothetical protein